MKNLSTVLCAAIAALMFGDRAGAETIHYEVTGWATSCASTLYIGAEGGCLWYGKNAGSLAQGTITGTATFVGDSASGGVLSLNSQVYATSSTPGVGPATVITTGWWFGLEQQSNPAGLTVVDGSPGNESCTPTWDIFCNTPRTPLPVTNIDIYGTGTSAGGTLVFLIEELFSAGNNITWYEYTLTVVPEPGTALLLGLGLFGLAASRRH